MATGAQIRLVVFSVAVLLLLVPGGSAEPIDPLVEKLIDKNAAAAGVFENVIYDVVQRDFSSDPDDPMVTTAQVVRKDGNQFTRADIPMVVAKPDDMPRLGTWRVTSVENLEYAAYWANFVGSVYQMDKDDLGQLSERDLGFLRPYRPADPQWFAGGDGNHTFVDHRVRFEDRVGWRAEESPEGFLLFIQTQRPHGVIVSECLVDKQTSLVTRCRTFHRTGRLISEYRCTYQEWKDHGTWFPSRIEKFTGGAGGLKLALTIDITNVSFDVRDVQPDQFVWTALELDPNQAKVLYRRNQHGETVVYDIEDGERFLRELPKLDD